MASSPLAYFISWTTYGTRLPGDERGWVDERRPGVQPPDAERNERAQVSMVESQFVMTTAQRHLVDATIRRHCEIRPWVLHALNVRTNHVHVVLTAPVAPETVMTQLKAWCTRRLKEAGGSKRQKWWTEHGSTKWINNKPYLKNAIHYVMEMQD